MFPFASVSKLVLKKTKKNHQTLVPAGMRKNLVGDVDILTQVEWITSSSEGWESSSTHGLIKAFQNPFG